MIALRTKSGTVEHRKADLKNLRQNISTCERVVLKKERVRKFMQRKKKQKLEEDEKSRIDEIQKTLKVH